VNPLGIKGCGEAGAAGGCPAVMNALGDALGVLDVQMPRKDGDEVVAQLRRLGYDGVVIAATASSEEGVLALAAAPAPIAVRASYTWHWAPGAAAAAVRFADGRAFVDGVDFLAAPCRVRHACAPDDYEGVFARAGDAGPLRCSCVRQGMFGSVPLRAGRCPEGFAAQAADGQTAHPKRAVRHRGAQGSSRSADRGEQPHDSVACRPARSKGSAGRVSSAMVA
jgi:CheY-like chemotaxis protein